VTRATVEHGLIILCYAKLSSSLGPRRAFGVVIAVLFLAIQRAVDNYLQPCLTGKKLGLLVFS